MSKIQAELRHFHRLWIFVTVVTVALVGVTVTLNVMHAPGGIVARSIGGTPPIFLFLCIELIARIPATSRLLGIGRVIGSVAVAGLAFAISYQQQMEFIHHIGYAGWVAYAYPIIVDGVMMVATLSLVEVTRKVRVLRAEIADLADAPAAAARAVTPDETAAERRGREFRAAAAKARNEVTARELSRKPFELTSVAEAA
jgi:hypothetical protein